MMAAIIMPTSDPNPDSPPAISPDRVGFLMVGCQRCGTTWVDGALREHPELRHVRELSALGQLASQGAKLVVGLDGPLRDE